MTNLVPMAGGAEMPVRVTPGAEASGDALVHVLEEEGIAYRNTVNGGVWTIMVRASGLVARGEVLRILEALVEDGF